MKNAVKKQLIQFREMLCFVKLNDGWAGYVKAKDYKQNWKGLYKTIRREFMDGNRAGVLFQDHVEIYFENNLDLKNPLVRAKRWKKAKKTIVVPRIMPLTFEVKMLPRGGETAVPQDPWDVTDITEMPFHLNGIFVGDYSSKRDV